MAMRSISTELPKFRDLRAVPDVPLLWPLLSATLVLAVLSGFGFQEQQQLEQRALALALAPIEQTARTVAQHIDNELTVTEHSLHRYRDSLSEALVFTDPDSINRQAEQFGRLTERDSEGALRPRREQFRPERDASIFVPNFARLDAAAQARHARAKEVTEWFGRGTEERVLVDTWWMSPEGAIVLHSASIASHYAFDIAADYDYRPTDWYRLTLPEQNPQGLPRWTTLTFDEPSKVWMVSVVLPVHVNGRYQGSVGHDILLNRLLQDTTALRPVEGASFLLLDRDNQLVASDQYSAQLTRPGGSRALNDIVDSGWQQTIKAVHAALSQTGVRETRLQLDNHLVIATAVGSEPWLLINRVPLAPYQRPVHTAFTRLQGIALAALLAEVLLTLIVLWWNRQRVRRYHQEIETLHHELQAMSYAVSTELREPVSAIATIVEHLQEQTPATSERHIPLEKLASHCHDAAALVGTLQAYLRVNEQWPDASRVALTDVFAVVQAQLAHDHTLPAFGWHLGELPSVPGDRQLLITLCHQLTRLAAQTLVGIAQPELHIGARLVGSRWDICLLSNGNASADHIDRLRTDYVTDPVGKDIHQALVRRILHRHNGELDFDAAKPSGLLIHLWLPSDS